MEVLLLSLLLVTVPRWATTVVLSVPAVTDEASSSPTPSGPPLSLQALVAMAVTRANRFPDLYSPSRVQLAS